MNKYIKTRWWTLQFVVLLFGCLLGWSVENIRLRSVIILLNEHLKNLSTKVVSLEYMLANKPQEMQISLLDERLDAVSSNSKVINSDGMTSIVSGEARKQPDVFGRSSSTKEAPPPSVKPKIIISNSPDLRSIDGPPVSLGRVEKSEKIILSTAPSGTSSTASIQMTPGATQALVIEGVEASKAKIKALYPDAVEFSGGQIFKVGQVFPSGETLYSVDPSNAVIATDRRKIMVWGLDQIVGAR